MACLADLADAPVIGRHPMKPAPDLLPLLERPATSSATVGPAPLLTPPLAPPLARLAGKRTPWLYAPLSKVPILRTHNMFILRKPLRTTIPETA